MTEPYRPIIERSLVDEGQYEELEIANPEVVQLIKEFDRAINDAIASVHFAILGLHALRTEVEAIRKLSGKEDPGINLTSSDENVGFFARWTASEILEKARHDGLVGQQLGAQLLVFLYSLWEEDYRGRFANAHGLGKKDDLKVTEFGDLGRMRNDIVHHRSVATQKNTGGCQVLRWFKPGDVIRPRDKHFFEFVARFPWKLLALGPPTSSGEPGAKDDVS